MEKHRRPFQPRGAESVVCGKALWVMLMQSSVLSRSGAKVAEEDVLYEQVAMMQS